MKLSESVDFIIPTSICPEHPNANIIKTAIESVWEMFGERIRPTIICDYPSPFFNDKDRIRYLGYVKQLCQWGNVIEQPQFVGQVGAVLKFFKSMNPKPVIYYHHDDWQILGPARVDVAGLVRLLMDDSKNVEMVKLHKRVIKAVDVPRRVDHIKVPTEEFGVPLIKCSGWGTSPHFASRRHYTERIVPYLSLEDLDPHGRRGIENVVYEAYRREQIDTSFQQAHDKWGVYIYGRFGDGPYLRHMGIERLKRRRANGDKFGVTGSGFTYTG